MDDGKINAILGGHCNNDNGLNYAGIFGCCVIAVACNTFHVECLNACNTPVFGGSGTYPFGTIFTCCCGCGLPMGALPLFIQF